MGGGDGEGGGGDGEGGGGDGGNTKRAPQSAQSVPLSHWTGVPNKSKSEPGPPSWHALLFARPHVLVHHIGGGEGGGEGGGGEGGGEGGGGEGGGEGGEKKRGPQSVQSVPKMHRATAPYRAVCEPGPPSWHAPLLA